jgi:hypothetical protein
MELTDPKHFKTTDQPLAIALATAGCRLASQEEDGPAISLYTPEFLRSRGLIKGKVAPSEFERVASDAFDKKIPGSVTYLFVRDDVFKRAMDAWDAMVNEYEKADEENREPESLDIDEATAMRVMYTQRVNARLFKTKVPFYREPLFKIGESTSREVPISGRPVAQTVTEGSMKSWSRNLSNESRKALGIHPRPRV